MSIKNVTIQISPYGNWSYQSLSKLKGKGKYFKLLIAGKVHKTNFIKKYFKKDNIILSLGKIPKLLSFAIWKNVYVYIAHLKYLTFKIKHKIPSKV